MTIPQNIRLNIRKEYKGGMKPALIARLYRVSESSVANIIREGMTMTGCQDTNPNVINNDYKRLTCQASHCEYNDRRASCTHEWMELDDHGICIFFERRQENLANKPISPASPAPT